MTERELDAWRSLLFALALLATGSDPDQAIQLFEHWVHTTMDEDEPQHA